MHSIRTFRERFTVSWLSVGIISVAAAYLFVFMEWLFQITKPSFMSAIPLTGQISIFLMTGTFVSAICIIGIGLLCLIDQFVLKSSQGSLTFLGLLLPTAILSILALLLIDNFTYTVLDYGIIDTQGIVRVLYAILFLVAFFLLYQEIGRFTSLIDSLLQKANQRTRNIFSLVSILTILVVGSLPTATNAQNTNLVVNSGSSVKKPNIFFITADGLRAQNMSLYGYERETTPFLDDTADSSLVSMNTFNNSSSTTGSIISMFTSKSPLETRVLYPPDILRGDDSYQHLPAILKNYGYYTAQYGTPRYVDAFQTNLRNGFDEANGRMLENNVVSRINQWFPTNMSYLLYELANRTVDRLRHIYFIKQMTNPAEIANSPEDYDDMVKLSSIVKLLDRVDQPIFAHLHWMGTHGYTFYPEKQVFSAGKKPYYQEEWDVDFYDDSILDFDRAIKILYKELKSRDMIDNSIIVVATDHGQKWVMYERLPLMIIFPNGEIHNTLNANIQYMDIAPTLLDYMGIEKPEWMTGMSLLGDIPEDRPVFSTSPRGDLVTEKFQLRVDDIKPPFFQFARVSTIVCDTFYEYNLVEKTMRVLEIAGYVGECPDEPSSLSEASEMIIAYLDQLGYDTSSLEILE